MILSTTEKNRNLHRETESNLLEITNVCKTYNSSKTNCTALKNINLNIKQKEFTAIVGKSGCGKSTLLNLIAGIDVPTEGEIHFEGNPIHNLSQDKASIWRGKSVGVVFQFFQLLPTLTILENVIMPMDLCKTYPLKERKTRAYHILEKLNIADQANKLPSELSGGQQQRASIARALANNPKMILADEPTGNLDSKTAEVVHGIFRKLSDDGNTVLMVTHENDIKNIVSRSITLSDGEIVLDTRN
ncbi:MAG TPA: ABC transporter ATP-binding protein [Spirochaetia bacterium]|nr:ABC transporter ATP-binding protein [Spirochaetia bacterium]HBI38703.1 ABC transporter ATP-binding protein [Spirochaetia bacterium]